MLSFLKQVRMLRIILYAESVAVISVLWYGIRLGEDFTRSNGFTGLDVFLFCLGNYPEKWEGAWMPDHYLIVAFPFLLLMQQLISYTDTNSRGRIYYIGFRRESGWKQAVYDGKRMLFLITSWLIFWEVTESVLFHFLYGNGRESFFLQNRITESVELFFIGRMILRQIVVLLIISLLVYGIQFWLGTLWAAVFMTGAVSGSILLGFSGSGSAFAVNSISNSIRGPLLFLLLLLLLVFMGKKYLKTLYLHEHV